MARREAVGVIRQPHPALRERRACELVGTTRSSYRYRLRPEHEQADRERRERLRELAAERRRFGYRHLQVLLGREGWRVNHNEPRPGRPKR